MAVTLSAIESSQPFPACTKVLANDGLRIRIVRRQARTSSPMAADCTSASLPQGGKPWRLRYEFDRKEKLLSIGRYPSVGGPFRGRTGP
jgi:hypothetical protein